MPAPASSQASRLLSIASFRITSGHSSGSWPVFAVNSFSLQKSSSREVVNVVRFSVPLPPLTFRGDRPAAVTFILYPSFFRGRSLSESPGAFPAKYRAAFRRVPSAGSAQGRPHLPLLLCGSGGKVASACRA